MIAYLVGGGWSMWSILIVGVALCATAARFAWRPKPDQLAFLGTMALATLTATLQGVLVELGSWLSDPQRGETTDLARTVTKAFLANTPPASFGGALLCLAALLVAVGASRLPSRLPSRRCSPSPRNVTPDCA
jgi:hypothetical protein